MTSYYRRQNTLKEKRNLRRAYFYIFLSIVLVGVMMAFGVALLNNISDYVDRFKKPAHVFVGDTTPPPPPNFDSFAEYTNDPKLTISGRSEPGASVILNINDTTEEVLVNNDGEFRLTIDLAKGANTIKAYSQDSAGNQSITTDTIIINLDTEAPDIEVTEPSEGQEFYGNAQRQLSVRGITEKDAEMTINGRFVRIDSDGNFEYQMQMTEGANNLNIKSTDRAGNQKEINVGIKFTP